MGSETRKLPTALALSALGQWFGSGLHPLWLLAWLAPVPLLVAAPRLGPWAAFATAAAAHAIGDLNTWTYASIVPVPIHLALVVAPALAWGASVLLYRRFVRMGRLGSALLSVPVAWTVFEYLWESASPHGTFFDLAYTQMNCVPVIQVAALAGHLGIGFCLVLAASAISLLAASAPASGKARVVAPAFLALAAVLAYGGLRASSAPTGPEVTVGLIASDVPGNIGARDPKASEALFRTYLAHVPEVAARGAAVVILPEHLGAFVDDSRGGNASALDALFGAAAKANHVYILAGVDAVDAQGVLWNQSRLYAPDGVLAGTYDKHHLLPGPESPFRPGSRLTVVPTPMGTWGLEICKDMDFPALSRDYGRAGIGLLLVPALDFGVDGWLHGRMAVLRGVESGFSIARSAAFGRLTLTDDRGRVRAESDAGAAPFAEVVASVPVRHDATLYDRLGDWFAWLNGAVLVALMAIPTRSRRPD
jgi:apolipoprotein N-acyltransferase